MATASWFVGFCGYVTSLAWVKLWCKKRVVSVGVLAGKLLPGHVVQFPLLISSWVWGKDQLNACRRILHPFPCHSWLICQEAKTDNLHYSKREKMALSRFQSVSKSLLCLINLSRHCAWIVTNYTKNLSSTWIVRKVKAHLILVWFFFCRCWKLLYSSLLGFVVPRVLENREVESCLTFASFVWELSGLMTYWCCLTVCFATFSCASIWNRSWESLMEKAIRTLLSAFLSLDEKN